MGGGVLQQGPGQFDAGSFDNPDLLTAQGPDHSRTIRDHQISRSDRLTQGCIGPGRHRHLSVEGDDASAAPGMQTECSSTDITAGIHRHAEHLAAAMVIGGGADRVHWPWGCVGEFRGGNG